jgi:hypothetical protein
MKRWRWHECLGRLVSIRKPKRLCGRLNRSGYRGISHRPDTGVLGMYLMGVKEGPKVRRRVLSCEHGRHSHLSWQSGLDYLRLMW